MNLELRRYVIFDVEELETIDFSEVMETSLDTVRKRLDGSKAFIKFVGEMPLSVTALTTRSQEYSIEEIRAIVCEDEWTDPDSDPV